MTEIWDIYDASGEKTGTTAERDNGLLPDRQYHIVVHIWLYNTDGELLIQKRADHVYWMPGKWAATGGSVISGEDSLTGAIRETQEELGLALSKDKFQLITRVLRRDSLLDIWVAETSMGIDGYTLEDAVSDIGYVTPSELKEMIADGSFIDYTDGEGYTDHIMQQIFSFAEKM
jgi:isopentenyldiphosphate isomerase